MRLISILIGLAQIALTHVTIIDMIGERPLADTTVVITGERISAVGKSGTVAIPAGARVIDATGKYLIPGLWDMHVHLSYARASALPVLVANGVTGVRDMGSDLGEIDAWRAQIAAGVVTGPRIVRAGPMLNDRSRNPYQIATGGPEQARGIVRALKQVGVDFIKVHRRVPRDDYVAIVDEANKQGLRVVGHIPMSVRPEEASDAGQQIEHAYTIFEGTMLNGRPEEEAADVIEAFLTNPANDSLFARFAHNHTVVDATLAPFHQIADPEWFRDPRMRYVSQSLKDLFAKQYPPMTDKDFARNKRVDVGLQAVVGRMYWAGVVLLAGTDTSVARPPGFLLHDELALLASAGLPPLEALRTATLNPAKIMKRESDFGSVAIGRLADLLLLDANPLDDIHNTQRIRAVIVGGKLLDRAALDKLLALGERLASQN
jgi:imidazolonepropionase-like amidohydrolase